MVKVSDQYGRIGGVWFFSGFLFGHCIAFIFKILDKQCGKVDQVFFSSGFCSCLYVIIITKIFCKNSSVLGMIMWKIRSRFAPVIVFVFLKFAFAER